MDQLQNKPLNEQETGACGSMTLNRKYEQTIHNELIPHKRHAKWFGFWLISHFAGNHQCSMLCVLPGYLNWKKEDQSWVKKKQTVCFNTTRKHNMLLIICPTTIQVIELQQCTVEYVQHQCTPLIETTVSISASANTSGNTVFVWKQTIANSFKMRKWSGCNLLLLARMKHDLSARHRYRWNLLTFG